MKTFAKGRATFYALIVPINSPLKPILQKASNTLLEAGTMDYLVKVWEGKNSFIIISFFNSFLTYQNILHLHIQVTKVDVVLDVVVFVVFSDFNIPKYLVMKFPQKLYVFFNCYVFFLIC